MAGVDTTQEVQEVFYHSTINISVLCDIGVFLAVDARSTHTEVKKCYADKPWDEIKRLPENERCIWYIDSESEVKLLKLHLQGKIEVGITASGSKMRNKMLWACIEPLAINYSEIDEFAKKVFYILQTSKPEENQSMSNWPQKRESCELLLAGFSIAKQAYVVYHMGDDVAFTMQSSLQVNSSSYSCFKAIGSGSEYASFILTRDVAPHMKYEDALSVIKSAVVDACFMDHCCGGRVHISWISNEKKSDDYTVASLRSTPIRDENFFTVMLGGPLWFPENMVFYLSSESNRDMNYNVLFECLNRKCDRFPFCLGNVWRGWKLYVAQFSDDKDLVEEYGRGNENRNYKGYLHLLRVEGPDDREHILVYTKAKPEYLADIHQSGPKALT